MNRGAVVLEWMLGLGTLLLALALSIEFAHWQTTRHIAAIALMEAARAGSREHAHPQKIERAFLHAMRARFAHGADSAQAMTNAFNRVSAQSGLPAWRIDQLAPHTADFRQASICTGAAIPQAKGRRVLRHDAFERDGQRRHLSARDGQPALSGARPGAPGQATPLTLHLQLTYLQPALFPWVARVIAAMTPAHAEHARAWAAGLVVIRLDQRIEMQSDAVQWAPPQSSRG